MKNHFLFALLLILCLPCSYAQQNLPPNVKITWSSPMKKPAQTDGMRLVAFNEDNFYFMRNKFKGFASYWMNTVCLERYNDSLQLAETGALPEKREPEDKRSTVDILNFANKTWLFSAHHDYENDITHHYVQTIDVKSLHLNNDVKKIGEKKVMRQKIYIVSTKKLAELMTEYDFKYRVSADRTKLMVLTKQRAIKDTPQQYTLQVFDADFNLLWAKDLQMKDKNTFLYNLSLDNDGNAYAMTRTYRDDKEKESDEPLCTHTVIGYFDRGNTTKKHQIQEEGEFTYDADMYLLGEGKVLINSFFVDEKDLKAKSKNKKMAISRGFVVTSVDLKNEKEIKEGFTTLDSIRGLLVGRSIVRREDGGFIVITQDYYDSIPAESFTLPSEASYGREDLVLMGVGSNHRVEWRTRVDRQSLTQYFTMNVLDYRAGSPSAMLPFIYQDKLYLIFNGLVTQPDEKKKKKFTNKRALWMVSIDAGGKAESYLLASGEDFNLLIDVNKCFSPSENELILYGENGFGENYRFARLRFE